jgi:hypothetical protein
MADLQEGESSADVKRVQQLLNEFYAKSLVRESGSFDDSTTEAVRTFQKDMKIRQSGIVDATTMKLLIKPPQEKAHQVNFNGQKLVLSREQYAELLKAAARTAAPTVKGYARKAQEARNLWNDLDKVRKDTFFFQRGVVDLVSKKPFPNESLIRDAESAVSQMQSALNSNDIEVLLSCLKDGSHRVAAASIAIAEYQDAFFTGGDQIVKTLTIVRDGSKITMSVLAAVASGGASIQATAAIMASEGAFDSMLGQIEKAGNDPKFSIVDGIGNVLTDGAIAGFLGALMHNKEFVSGLTKSLAEKIGQKVLKKYGSALAGKMAEKIVKNMLDGGIKATIKKLIESIKPGSKITVEEAIEEIVKEMLTAGALGAVIANIEDGMESFSQNMAKYFAKSKMFAGLGDVDPVKAFAAGGEAIIEEAVKRLAPDIILAVADNARMASQIDKLIAEAIRKDPKVNKDLADLVKKKKLK